jgi:hypothetical protein
MTKKRILGCLRVPPVEYHCYSSLELGWLLFSHCVTRLSIVRQNMGRSLDDAKTAGVAQSV